MLASSRITGATLLCIVLGAVASAIPSHLDKRQTITSPHQFDVLPESEFPNGPDTLKGVTPKSGPTDITAHQFESDCIQYKGGIEGGLQPASCGLPYEAMPSRKGSSAMCSGFAASSFPCGSCIKLTYKGRSTHVRVVGGGPNFDISYTNYLEIADPEDYAKAYDPPRSGAGTNPLHGATYEEVAGSACDRYWDGRCGPNIVQGYSAASVRHDYGCGS